MFKSATWLRFYNSVKTPVRIAVNYDKMRRLYIRSRARHTCAPPLLFKPSVHDICVPDSEVKVYRGIGVSQALGQVGGQSILLKENHPLPFSLSAPIIPQLRTRRQCRVLEPWGLSLILNSSTNFVQERPVITIWRFSVYCGPERSEGFHFSCKNCKGLEHIRRLQY